MGSLIQLPDGSFDLASSYPKPDWDDFDGVVKSNPCHNPSGPKGGQFCSLKGGGGSASLSPAPEDREEWPEHIKAMRIPPAWTNVQINPDPKAALQVIGRDAAGRAQYVYSKQFQESQAQVKFARIQELDAKFDKIRKQNSDNMKSSDPRVREHATCAALIMSTGIRPGSEADTGAKVKAYGATTLLSEHVVVKGGETRLQFVGKKGVALDIPVTDKSIASVLRRRASSTDGQLFPEVSGSSLLKYIHTLNGGGFKTKDFRTLVGTRHALNEMKGMKPPRTEKEYKKSVREVAKKVSTTLGNTPTVALQSYIHPAVFAPWRSSYGAS